MRPLVMYFYVDTDLLHYSALFFLSPRCFVALKSKAAEVACLSVENVHFFTSCRLLYIESQNKRNLLH